MRKILLLLLLTFVCSHLFCDELIDIYVSNFEKAKLDVKLQVLRDCVAKDIEGRGPLFNLALYYIINNYASIKEQYGSKEIENLAIEQVNTLLYKPARGALWDLFLLDSNTKIRVGILAALARLANDDPEIIKKMSAWLASQNQLFKFSKLPDLQVASACINALGAIADPASFPALLLVLYSGYPDTQRKQAEAAIATIRGQRKDLYIDMVNTHRLIEKKYAFESALADSKLTSEEKCEVAYATLKITVNEVIDTPEDKSVSRSIRNQAIVYLGNNGYSAAADLGIAHFKRSLDEYNSRIINSSDLLPVIRALGQLNSHNAAVALKDYLDSTNALFEDGKPYDEQIVLQVIQSLKNLKDKIARSALLYVGYLRYSDKIKKAAVEAFNAVK
jgi:HEAT repeat protein